MEDKVYFERKAKNFLKEYNVLQLSLDRLIEIVESQGYKIIKYNTFEEVSSTEQLLDELNLKEYSQVNTAFTYRDGNIKIVFIDDTLLDHDKLYALAHEEGHIYCGHMDRYNCSSASVDDEREANEFAHYVMSPAKGYKVGFFIRTHTVQTVLIACILALVIAAPFIVRSVQLARVEASSGYAKTLEYYVTESGSKYHTNDCKYIKYKGFVRKITEEFNSGLYEPCKECIK